MVKSGVGPAALVMATVDTIVAVGAIIAELPCVDQITIADIHSGDWVEVADSEVVVRAF
jgi:predicted aconitase with swiveling domain